MARNVEIKARLRDPAATRRLVEREAGGRPMDLDQVDTFFRAPAGRLKLREATGEAPELIWYDRPDATGPKESHFEWAVVGDAAAARALLAAALGVRLEVRKHRTVYHAGRTRVHLDAVEGLGEFLELEVQLAPGESTEAGAAEAHELMRRFGIGEDELVAGAYADLLEGRSGAT